MSEELIRGTRVVELHGDENGLGTTASPGGPIDTLSITGFADAASIAERVHALDPGRVVIAIEAWRSNPRELLEALGSLAIVCFELREDTLVIAADRGARADPISTERLLEVTEAVLWLARRRSAREVSARRRLMQWIAHNPRKAEVELSLARKKIAEQKMAFDRVFGTTIYRLGSAIVSLKSVANPRDALRVPRRFYELYRGRKTRELATPASDEKRAAIEQHRRELDRAYDDFITRISRAGHERFVVMFSGTTYLQTIRANRPIRLTRVLLDRGIPVYFSYHGALSDADRPVETHPLLFQSPVDYTIDVAPKLARETLGGAQRTFIVSYPHRAVPRFLNRFNAAGWVTIYDCRDDWEEFLKVADMGWYTRATEKFVVNNSDVTFCVSRPLRAKIASFTDAREVRVSPNAYDSKFLAPGWTKNAPGSPIKVGYFGHLTAAWFDWPSLAAIAGKRPDWKFEIVGDGAPAKLPELPPNVTLLGPKNHAEICALARDWRVAIIPFKTGRLADAVDPIKIYEYFALELPVVSFRMPQIADYPYTETVESVDAFVAALDRAVALKPEKKIFWDFLAQNTWENRVDQLLAAAREPNILARFEKHLPR